MNSRNAANSCGGPEVKNVVVATCLGTCTGDAGSTRDSWLAMASEGSMIVTAALAILAIASMRNA